MAVIKATAKGLPAMLARKHKSIARAIARGALAGAERGRALIVRKTPVDQGQLKASWKVLPGSPTALQGEFKRGTLLAELLNTAPHAGIVERGARPHTVSAEGWLAIYDWVVRHRQELGLVTATGKARRVRKGRVAVHQGLDKGGVGLDSQIAGITWAIVKKIQREGSKATYFVRGNLEDLRAVVQREVDRGLEAEGNKGSSGPAGLPAGGP